MATENSCKWTGKSVNSHYLNTIQELNQRITELEVELAKYKGAEKAASQQDSVSKE